MPFDDQYIDALLEEPNKETIFSSKFKIDNKNRYNNNLNGDNTRYSILEYNFRYMLPTELAALHSENIKGLKRLQDIYRKKPNKKNYNRLAEFHNILTISQTFLKIIEDFIQLKVKELKKDKDFEYKIDEYLKTFRRDFKESIDGINADKYLTKDKKSFFISNDTKKLLWYESIYNEVRKRLKKLISEGEYMEVSPASGNHDNVEPASGVQTNVEHDNVELDSDEPDYGVSASGIPASGVPASGVSASGVQTNVEPASGVPASDEPASGGNRRRRIRNRKHTKVTRRSRVIRTTRVIRKRKI
jgi:hypothetical protein